MYNRRFYEDELRHKFLTAGVAMIDLDDFKLCNDTFGHEAGDAALCAVASIIQHNIRSSDMLIRYGGDELLLILPMIPADDFARKLRLINKKLSGARVRALSASASPPASVACSRQASPSRRPSSWPTNGCTRPSARKIWW